MTERRDTLAMGALSAATEAYKKLTAGEASRMLEGVTRAHVHDSTALRKERNILIAMLAYEMADAMIAVSKEPQT